MDVVSVGECMVELARGGDGRFGLAYGGDTFNTAVYLSRAGIATAYATALGDDPHSDAIAAAAAAEGVSTAAIARLPGRVPGLYMIETDEAGERTFLYWRDNAAARDLFSSAAGDPARDMMTRSKIVYFSGITLWLYSDRNPQAFFDALDAARTAGARIAFDGNYRTRLWGRNTDLARTIFAEALKRTDIALPTFDDEQMLWGDAAPADTLARIRAAGVGEVAVKLGARGCLAGGEAVAPEREVVPVDTTAAGDSFNAGYIAARLSGRSPLEAAAAGNRLAAAVIGHRGAIVPREATAGVLAL